MRYTCLFSALSLCYLLQGCANTTNGKPVIKTDTVAAKPVAKVTEKKVEHLDTARYNKLMLHLVQDKPTAKWPVKTAYPQDGAILPFKRIVAYYGNFYSTRMGILGELPPEQMLERLQQEVKHWTKADSTIPAIPAIHYITVSAQGSPGKDGKYRLRMPSSQIDKALALANKINGILFLDIQVGQSKLQNEVPLLEKYLSMPNVHLAIDPEFAMHGQKPGTRIGTMDAADINYASAYLKKLVDSLHLPPKVLVVHRFTNHMLTGYKSIKTYPEVQVVINMDGFGFPAKKVNSYRLAVTNEPVQFAGLKLFYKNDKADGPHRLMTDSEVLKLPPAPVYIQYQ